MAWRMRSIPYLPDLPDGRRWCDAGFELDVREMADTVLEGADHGSVMAYMWRRFGYPEAGWDPHKEICAAWLVTTPDPRRVLSVKPHPLGPRYGVWAWTDFDCSRTGRAARGGDAAALADLERLRDAARRALGDLTRWVAVDADMPISICGAEHGGARGRGPETKPWRHAGMAVQPDVLDAGDDWFALHAMLAALGGGNAAKGVGKALGRLRAGRLKPAKDDRAVAGRLLAVRFLMAAAEAGRGGFDLRRACAEFALPASAPDDVAELDAVFRAPPQGNGGLRSPILWKGIDVRDDDVRAAAAAACEALAYANLWLKGFGKRIEDDRFWDMVERSTPEELDAKGLNSLARSKRKLIAEGRWPQPAADGA